MQSSERLFNNGRMLIFRPDGTFEKDLFAVATPGHTHGHTQNSWSLLQSSPQTAVALGEKEDELYVGKFEIGRYVPYGSTSKDLCTSMPNMPGV